MLLVFSIVIFYYLILYEVLIKTGSPIGSFKYTVHVKNTLWTDGPSARKWYSVNLLKDDNASQTI